MTESNKAIFETLSGGKSLLWEVTGRELTEPSYFIGTMHLMCTEDAILSASLYLVMDEVKQVYLEADITNMTDLISGAANMKMADDITLADLLPEEAYQKTKLFFETHQPYSPFEILEQQLPLMLSSSLYELFLPCENKSGIDRMIVEEAKSSGKTINGLETIAFQTDLLSTIPYEMQARELVKTIEGIERYETFFNEMVAVYKDQDIDKLHWLTTKEESGFSSYLDVLLYNRNRDWVEKIVAIAQRNATLFAVGAGHLGGEEGVIKLLQKQGYTLRPLLNDISN